MLLIFGICALYVVFACLLFAGAAIIHLKWQKSDGIILFLTGMFLLLVGCGVVALIELFIKHGILKQ